MERAGVWPWAALLVLARPHPPSWPTPHIGTRAPSQGLLQAALGRSLHLYLVIFVQWARVCALPTTAAGIGGHSV